VEVVVVVAFLVALVAMLLLALANSDHKARRVNCMNNLKQINIALRTWNVDDVPRYPMEVPMSRGGAQELIAAGNVAGCFQVMSNELGAPKILICPEDYGQDGHLAATNWSHLGRTNVSYFIGLDVSATDPVRQGVLAGDANLVQNGRAIAGGVLSLGTNLTTWTQERHGGAANVLFCDGSVESVRQIGFTNAFGRMICPTNRVVVP
jgi:prepilin-type processing-associated H-X9-DG protein